jgi:hypothetical protein
MAVAKGNTFRVNGVVGGVVLGNGVVAATTIENAMAAARDTNGYGLIAPQPNQPETLRGLTRVEIGTGAIVVGS